MGTSDTAYLAACAIFYFCWLGFIHCSLK